MGIPKCVPTPLIATQQQAVKIFFYSSCFLSYSLWDFINRIYFLFYFQFTWYKIDKGTFYQSTVKLSSNVTEIIFHNLSSSHAEKKRGNWGQGTDLHSDSIGRRAKLWTLLTGAGIVSLQSLFVNLR